MNAYYYGAPNVLDYFDSNSLSTINIFNFDESLRTIESLLNHNSFYEKHLNCIEEQKMRYLDEYNFFPYITKIINRVIQSGPQGPLSLKSESKYGFKNKLRNVRKKYGFFK